MSPRRTISRSTPRLRLTAALLVATLVLVAVSERPLAAGLVGTLVQLAGVALVSLAALGRVWTSAFIAGQKDTALVRTGPYSALRHPLYALSLLAMAGLGLVTRSALLAGALVVVFALVYRRSARSEDEFLARRYPEEHAEFAATRSAFWPDWGGFLVPETIELRPRVFWKSFLDAGSLVGFALLVCAADALQRAGVTPTLLVLP